VFASKRLIVLLKTIKIPIRDYLHCVGLCCKRVNGCFLKPVQMLRFTAITICKYKHLNCSLYYQSVERSNKSVVLFIQHCNSYK